MKLPIMLWLDDWCTIFLATASRPALGQTHPRIQG